MTYQDEAPITPKGEPWVEFLVCLGIIGVVAFLALIAFFPTETGALLVQVGEWAVRVTTDNGGYWGGEQ